MDMSNITLETKSLHLAFCAETGALVDLAAPNTGWHILDRPELGLSWRLMVPLGEELRNNDVHGEKQKLASVTRGEDRITFVWENPVSERGGVIDCTVTLTVRAEGIHAVYEMHIENRSAYVIENVYCPYLGDVRHPQGAKQFEAFRWGYASGHTLPIWPTFISPTGYFGVDNPTVVYGASPTIPFFLLKSEAQGLYAGVYNSDCEIVSWSTELRPGWDSSINANVPADDNISGKPVHMLFAALHVPYIMPGESRSITPISLAAYTGGWQEGVDVYKNWRDTWMKPAVAPEWARNPHSWLQIHINSPEDELRMRFTELPKVAAECAAHGVKAIQLVGWNDGGQDQGNPSHDPDPRLGTYEELKQAIAEIKAMGVKLILFTKFIWADRATQWFRDELHKYAAKDPYGDYYVYNGYQYQTGTQLLNINTKRLIPMCYHSDKYREICEQEMRKVIDLGADGMLFDESSHHSPSLACFDESHGHRYGAPTYKLDRELMYRFRRIESIPSDFLFAGEACYDWLMEAYQLSYHRSENKTHLPLNRYLHPHTQHMTAVTGFNDRNMLNQCLMYRYIVSYEPFNFKGQLADFPMTIEYGKKMDALRTEYRKWFWDGEFVNTYGVSVTDTAGAAHPSYSVFKAADGSLGVVICNYEDAEILVNCKGETGERFTAFRIVDEDAWKSAAGGVVIPARSAAVLLQEK